MVKAVFLQARLDSSRLPCKVLLQLADKSVLEHCMVALSQINADLHCLLTSKDSLKYLEPYAHKTGWTIFAGPKENVLLRFCLAAQKYGVDLIIRATADNPLVSANMAQKAIDIFCQQKADYAAITGLPLGTGVEIINSKALYLANHKTYDRYDKEHVTPYLYNRPQQFQIILEQAPKELVYPDTRLTLDTINDYKNLCVIFEKYYTGIPLEISALNNWLVEQQ